jgi:hypothetical protein
MIKIVEVAEQLGLVAPEHIAGFIQGAPVDAFCRIVEITTKAILADVRAAGDETSGTAVLASHPSVAILDADAGNAVPPSFTPSHGTPVCMLIGSLSPYH